eukprot:387057_1
MSYFYIHIFAHNKRNRNPSPENTAAIDDIITSETNDFSFAPLNCCMPNNAVNTNPRVINPIKYCKKFSGSIGPSKNSCSILLSINLSKKKMLLFLSNIIIHSSFQNLKK